MGKTANLIIALEELNYAIRNRCFTTESDRIVKNLETLTGRYELRVKDLISFYQIENFDVFQTKINILLNNLGGK